MLSSFEPVILLLGPPGSGKGTFSQLAKEKGYLHLSAGDFIRDEITNKTPFGLIVEDIVKKGNYVDQTLFAQMMKEKIIALSSEGKPLIIDGYGRVPEDVQFLANTLSDLQLTDRTFVLFFDADDTICKERISGRIICNNCHHVYSTKNTSLHIGDFCLNCIKGILEERINDTPFVIEKRMLEYRKNIEKSYRTSFNFFPVLFFNSGQESLICKQFYQTLLTQIKNHEGDSKSFIQTLY